MSGSQTQPWVIAGNPSDAEVAAVVAALTAATSAATQATAEARPGSGPGPEETSGWSAYWRGLRGALPSGPGAWTASGHPRT